MTLTPRVPEEREARLDGRGSPAAAFETPRCVGLLRHAAYRIILDAFWYQRHREGAEPPKAKSR